MKVIVTWKVQTKGNNGLLFKVTRLKLIIWKFALCNSLYFLLIIEVYFELQMIVKSTNIETDGNQPISAFQSFSSQLETWIRTSS